MERIEFTYADCANHAQTETLPAWLSTLCLVSLVVLKLRPHAGLCASEKTLAAEPYDLAKAQAFLLILHVFTDIRWLSRTTRVLI